MRLFFLQNKYHLIALFALKQGTQIMFFIWKFCDMLSHRVYIMRIQYMMYNNNSLCSATKYCCLCARARVCVPRQVNFFRKKLMVVLIWNTGKVNNMWNIIFCILLYLSVYIYKAHIYIMVLYLACVNVMNIISSEVWARKKNLGAQKGCYVNENI